MERLLCCIRRDANRTEYKTIDLETFEERRARWRSIRIIYLTMFVMSTGFTIILTGVWPYLNKLDPHAGKEFLGFVTAANPLAETIFSPILGYWSNKSGSVRMPLLATLALLAMASTGYSLLEAFPAATVKYWMIVTRFLIGVSAANVTVIRSYLSAATTLGERTGAMSMLALWQVLGYISGPIVQAAVTPLGADGVQIIPGFLVLNMYTSVGWVIVLLSVLCFVLLLPSFFEEKHIAAKEAMRKQGISLSLPDEKNVWKSSKLDYLAAFSLIVGYFVLVFNISLLENLGIPIVMDQFAWTNAEAVFYMSILMAVGAVISVVVIALLKLICNFFSETSVVIYGGFLFMLLGRMFYIPWGDAPPVLMVADAQNLTNPIGCPVAEQHWCADTPAMTIPQLLIGYLFTCAGYPIGVTVIFSLFSKILGPRPQGVWMGIMMAMGSFARAIGTVILSFMYVELGTTKTFVITSVMMFAYGVWMVLVSKRLEPKEAASPLPRETKMIFVKDAANGSNGHDVVHLDEERQALKQ